MWPVTCSLDLVGVVSTGLVPHDHVQPLPTGPVPVPAPQAWDAEWVTTMAYPGGLATGASALASSVLHRGMRIALDGHDVGPLIGHAPAVPGPNDVLYAAHTLSSSREVVFSAHRVKAEGTAVAVVALSAPMLACADPVPLPVVACPTNALNSMVVGMSARDVLAGWGEVLVAMVQAAVQSAMQRGRRSPDPGSEREALRDAVVGPPLSRRGWAAEQGLRTAGQVARGLTALLGYDGPVTFDLRVHRGDLVDLRVGLTREADGDVRLRASASAAGGLSAGRAEVTVGSDGVEAQAAERLLGVEAELDHRGSVEVSQEWL
ncbi:MAG: hypothetical protein ACFCGT_18850 [Sandaracinaceae bacterium]